jgi:hypothetical protein
MTQVRPVDEVVERRGITEVLHFTTNLGLIGVLATRALKARALLDIDDYLEFIFKANAARIRDRQYLRYVNLSISRLSPAFFKWSRRQHTTEDLYWCILSLTPEILGHDGVLYATTNNIWTGCDRARGGEGLEALFAKKVHRYSTLWAERQDGYPHNWPTCDYAEVLYPEQVRTDFLQRIYFETDDQMHHGAAQMRALNHPEIELVVAPELFSA